MRYDRTIRLCSGDRPPALREKAYRVAELLARSYGRPEAARQRDPLAQLVQTVLSQNTSDANSGRAYAALRARFPTWDAVSAAPEADVADAIRSGGLAHIKAGRIQVILREIRERQGRLDLSCLFDMPSEAVWTYLTGLPGVGPKSAACVLLFALGRPVLPVDTHVHRVARRLGLIGPETDAEGAHAALQSLLCEEHVYSFHVNMIAHGRAVCRARRPQCPQCPLRGECDAAPATRVVDGQERPA